MRMEYDDVAWEQSDKVFDRFKKKKVTKPHVLLAVTNFMAGYRPESRPVDRARVEGMGAFNLCYRIIFEDGFSSLLRFPCPGRVMFSEEKVRNEVAVMTFLRQNTKIPVPTIIHYGMGDESPAGLGPFILMEYVKHACHLMAQLRTPGYKRGERPFLNPDIEEEKLEFFYGQVADILLELSKPSFGKIGSLARDVNGDWGINHRPWTMNMNELAQLGNYPPKLLPQSAFTTASSYYQSLAKTECMHLTTQRNDAFDSEDDCRFKYVARKLFQKLAEESSLHNSSAPESGPFKLFSAVIDWEFTYAAPVEFIHSPPWWLLLDMPEEWPRGISNWKKTYQPRLETFLRVLKRQEDAAIAAGSLLEGQRLSGKMRESWDRGDFWINHGVRKSWAFDSVWPMMDAKFFGGDTALEQRDSLLCSDERTELLDDEDKEAIEHFIRKKLEDSKKRILDDWDD
ncbi:hypothetical protein SI65_03100 [Aspergillus cristatus]|uniref:Aminoglycoside phosphotransferase domain-containing protein n=1 Tax=Aspergillus cristatus TaxID=573508 RepID=A0A1E3BMR0_ASPCR|nr:hypothetical protein SI65_03100 [Aspergillus cristatus]